jgi:hypothetical protein
MTDDISKVTRRKFAGMGTAALAVAGMLSKAGPQQNDNGQSGAQEGKPPRFADHHLPNEKEPGPKNAPLDGDSSFGEKLMLLC